MKNKSLIHIVLITTTITIFSTFIITTAIYFYFSRSFMLKMEETTIKEIFNTLKEDIIYGLALRRKQNIKQIFKKYIDVANIENIILICPERNWIISTKKLELPLKTILKTKEKKLTEISKEYLIYKEYLEIKIPNRFSLERSILKNEFTYKTKTLTCKIIFIISRDKLEEALYNTAYIALIISIIATTIASIIALIMIRKTILPLKIISKQIKKISFGQLEELDKEFLYGGTKEVKELAESFNHMVMALKHKEEEVRKEIQGYIDELEQKNIALKNTIKQLKESQDQLIQAEKLAGLGIIAAGIAHEINNPLQVISGFCEILLYKTKDPKTREKLIKIKEHTEDIKQIVKSLSEYSKKEKKQEYINIIESIDAAIETVRLSKKVSINIEFIKKFQNGKLIIMGKKSEIQQIFVNLFINAAQAMKGKGKIFIIGEKQNNHIKIIVKDTGPGIPKEIRNSIFDPFFTTKEPGEGTGLGLNIVYRIITKYQGRIRVLDNDPGAVFEIIFPSAGSKTQSSPETQSLGE